MSRKTWMALCGILIVAPINGTVGATAGRYAHGLNIPALGADWMLDSREIVVAVACLAVLCLMAGLRRS